MNKETQNTKLVIIGAGPAGISLAVEARLAGYSPDEVIILEKGEAHSWAIRKFYPDAKPVSANYKGSDAICLGVLCIVDTTKDGLLSYLDQNIEDHQLQVHYGETVSDIAQNTDGFTIETSSLIVKAETVAIAIGILGRPNKPSYRLPSSLRKRFHYDITSSPIEDADVLVVGGGDSASEYAQFLSQMGNRVSLSYRRDTFARMNRINVESLLALEQRGSVQLIYPSTIAEISEVEGKPTVHFADDLPDRSYDHVVFALGGSTPVNFLKKVGIHFHSDKVVALDGYQTNIPGLFLVGDLTSGRRGGSIIAAFNSAHEAMIQIVQSTLADPTG